MVMMQKELRKVLLMKHTSAAARVIKETAS